MKFGGGGGAAGEGQGHKGEAGSGLGWYVVEWEAVGVVKGEECSRHTRGGVGRGSSRDRGVFLKPILGKWRNLQITNEIRKRALCVARDSFWVVCLLTGTGPMHCILRAIVIAARLGPFPLLWCCRLGNP